MLWNSVINHKDNAEPSHTRFFFFTPPFLSHQKQVRISKTTLPPIIPPPVSFPDSSQQTGRQDRESVPCSGVVTSMWQPHQEVSVTRCRKPSFSKPGDCATSHSPHHLHMQRFSSVSQPQQPPQPRGQSEYKCHSGQEEGKPRHVGKLLMSSCGELSGLTMYWVSISATYELRWGLSCKLPACINQVNTIWTTVWVYTLQN